MTMEWWGFASAALSHPEPYWNGMLNIVKKSLKHIWMLTRKGRPIFGSGCANMLATYMPLWRVGMFDCISARMSRYVIMFGSDFGSSALYARAGSQLSRRT